MTKILVKKKCAGLYTYTLGKYVVEVVSRDPNPAFGDTKEMWVAAALWTHNLYTDPLETKREAVKVAKAMLIEKFND